MLGTHLRGMIDVRMAEDELIGRAVANVDNIEITLFFTDAGIEADVQQHVAQFLANFVFIVLHQGICQFKSFFNRVWAQAFVCLLLIPRTVLT